MSTEDPIRSALAEVEADDDLDHDPGAGIPEMGEEADARPEGPMPEVDADDVDEGGFSVLSWASEVPEGSHRNYDATDWWDPEGGGENRLAFHLSTVADSGGGYPNGIGVLVALAELYWRLATEQQGGSSGDGSDDEQDAPDAETVDRETAEALV